MPNPVRNMQVQPLDAIHLYDWLAAGVRNSMKYAKAESHQPPATAWRFFPERIGSLKSRISNTCVNQPKAALTAPGLTVHLVRRSRLYINKNGRAPEEG